MRHGTCFRRRLSTHHAGAAPHSAVVELGVVRQNQTMNTYRDRILATKSKYPFARWRESGLDQYTDEACASFTAVFDTLIHSLISLGESASEEAKIQSFKQVVEALNALNEEDESLIETGEREDLCELCNVIAVATGINPEDYGDGEGPASEWRDW